MPAPSAGWIVAFTGRSNGDYAFQLWEVADWEGRMTAHVRLCRLLLAAAASALALAMPGAAAELNPAALAYKLPDQIKWNPPSAAGSQNAVLVGDPSKPGLYAVRNKWLKGPFQPPALPSQRPLHHRAERDVVDGQRSDIRSRPQRWPSRRHLRHPFRQAGALGRRQGRGRLAGDRRRWARDEHGGRS